MEIHEIVRTKRKEKGLTQTELASKLNIPVSTYHNYERGRRKIPVDKLKEISFILDVPIQNFFH